MQTLFSVVDAMGKIPAGVLQGNIRWIGAYDQCLEVQASEFNGQYCQTGLNLVYSF